MSKLIIVLTALILKSCAPQDKQTKKSIEQERSLKDEVETRFELSGYNEALGLIFIYNNQLMAEIKVNNEVISNSLSDPISQTFKSNYYFLNDTLVIDGAFGLWGGTGFSIKIADNDTNVYHLVAADEFPIYAYSRNDSMRYRLDVPCSSSYIQLEGQALKNDTNFIYGYVEFNSNEYFQIINDSISSIESKFKVYFKSAYLDLKKLNLD